MPLATIDRLFIATNANVSITSFGEGFPERDLTRFEFYEIIVRLAAAKYKDPGFSPDYASALKKLLEDNIYPNLELKELAPFRREDLWNLDVHDVVQANFAYIK